MYSQNAHRIYARLSDCHHAPRSAHALGRAQTPAISASGGIRGWGSLIDIFLGVTAYSLQNHPRTTAKEIGQVEVEEIYVAVDRHDRQFIHPVQAKGGSDRLGLTPSKYITAADLESCALAAGPDGV